MFAIVTTIITIIMFTIATTPQVHVSTAQPFTDCMKPRSTDSERPLVAQHSHQILLIAVW
jgi:hypothetical protein